MHMQKKKKNLDKDLPVFTKIITDLNVRGKTIFQNSQKITWGKNPDDLKFGDDFLDMTPRAQFMMC